MSRYINANVQRYADAMEPKLIIVRGQRANGDVVEVVGTSLQQCSHRLTIRGGLLETMCEIQYTEATKDTQQWWMDEADSYRSVLVAEALEHYA